MIKLYITAIDSNKDGTAVTLFEDYLVGYDDKDDILNAEETINHKIYHKLYDMEMASAEDAKPF